MDSVNTAIDVAQGDIGASAVERKTKLDAIYRKVALRLVPFLFIVFVVAWIDRVNVGFTKLQMNESLGFSETVYGLGAGIFFLGYFLFEVPSNLVLQRFGARLTISRIAIGWGLSCIVMAFVTTSTGFYVMRFVIGAFEAGLWPGLVLYLTYWFPTTRSAKAFALIGCGSSASGIIGGPLAGLIMDHMNGLQGWGGWQWVFVLEGIPSVLLGIAAIWLLSDRPQEARWLTDDERRLLIEDLAQDRKQIGDREHSFWRAFGTRQVWTFVLIYFCIIMGQSAMFFWAPTILKDLGFTSSTTIGMIISGIFCIAIVAVVLNGIDSDRAKEVRFHCGLGVLAGALGCVALSILLLQGSQWAILALCIAIPGILCSVPVFWQLPNRVMVGTAAAAGLALINSIGNLGGFAAPFLMGVIKDATGHVTYALWLVAALLALGAFLTMMQPKTQKDA
jgi:sugar phosphate permease